MSKYSADLLTFEQVIEVKFFISLAYKALSFSPILKVALARQLGAVIGEPLTTGNSGSSGPLHAGFLSGHTWEGLSSTCEWLWGFCLLSSQFPPTINLADIL